MMTLGFSRRSGITVLMTILGIIPGKDCGALVDRADDVLTQGHDRQHQRPSDECKDDGIFGCACAALVSPKAARICQLFPPGKPVSTRYTGYGRDLTSRARRNLAQATF
jgi:hypothetical protein